MRFQEFLRQTWFQRKQITSDHINRFVSRYVEISVHHMQTVLHISIYIYDNEMMINIAATLAWKPTLSRKGNEWKDWRSKFEKTGKKQQMAALISVVRKQISGKINLHFAHMRVRENNFQLNILIALISNFCKQILCCYWNQLKLFNASFLSLFLLFLTSPTFLFINKLVLCVCLSDALSTSSEDSHPINE